MSTLVAEDIHRQLLPTKPTPEDFEGLEQRLLQLPQTDCPLVHRFAPGVYLREIEMPAGTFVIGAEHREDHFNVVLTGHAQVLMDGVMHDIKAPCTFRSAPGVRKVLHIRETMKWQTIHANPTDETDIDKLEARIVSRTQTDLLCRKDLLALQNFTQTQTTEGHDTL